MTTQSTQPPLEDCITFIANALHEYGETMKPTPRVAHSMMARMALSRLVNAAGGEMPPVVAPEPADAAAD